MEFPINEALVGETTKLKEERRVVQERIAKILANKNQVTATVFERVNADYQQKLHEVTAALRIKKSEIDKELATLYETRTRLQGNCDAQQEQLEELRFRQSLGEFDAEGFQAQAGALEEKLKKFTTLVEAVANNIARYEGLFADEPDLAPPPASTEEDADDAAEAAAEAAFLADAEEGTPAERAAAKLPITAEYKLESGEGQYFNAETTGKAKVGETRVFKPRTLEADTEVGPEPSAPGGPGPTLSIVKGTGSGAVYAVQQGLIIGRSNGSGIVLKEAKVSRQHAVLKRKGSTWEIHDLQSSNGVIVNGERAPQATLSDGDEIRIGDFVLRFSLQ